MVFMYGVNVMTSDKKVYYRKFATGLYQLAKPFQVMTKIKPDKVITIENIVMYPTGLLVMDKNYVSDGPSGPTIDTKSSIRGAFVHDAGYRLMRRSMLPIETRKAWDEEIRDLCIEDGMYVWRAKLWYRMLRLFAAKNAMPKNQSKIEEAP